MIKLMKKLFLTIILCFFITSNYSFAGTYFFDNCDTDDGETRSSARIELNSNLVHIYSINRKTGKEVINGTARIKTVTDDKIVHEKTPWRILASKNVSHDRTSRLLIDVVDQVETYYPKSKKIVITMMIDNVYDKKKRKKLKKLGVTSYPFKFSKYCTAKM